MPFTFAHPAAALPVHALGRGKLPLAALVVGSMMPDLGYFFAPMAGFRGDNHTLLRSFTFCLPWGMLLLAIVTLLEEGWRPLLPAALVPDGPIAAWTPRSLPWLAAGVVLGAWTHMLWDAWTHAGGFFVQRIPALAHELLPGVAVYNLLQHASTLLGSAALAFHLRRRLRGLRRDWRWGFWLAALGVASLAALARATAVTDERPLFVFITVSVHHLVLIAAGAALVLRLGQLHATRVRDAS